MEKLDSAEQRLWYATKTIENKWGKRALEDWIERDIYSRKGKDINNFSLHLPEPQSTLAQETLCDPYFFDFLNLPPGHIEKELEDGLVEKIQETLLAFGHGFAFVGRQHPLEIDGDTFYVDLLFYHIPSHRYIAVELKTEPFKPEHTGWYVEYKHKEAVSQICEHAGVRALDFPILSENFDSLRRQHKASYYHEKSIKLPFEILRLREILRIPQGAELDEHTQ